MFGKKKREAEARAKAAQEAAAKAKKQPKASWQKVSKGIVPVAKPAEYIQLVPIVQPIPIVPYSTQLQPLAMYDDSDEYEE